MIERGKLEEEKEGDRQTGSKAGIYYDNSLKHVAHEILWLCFLRQEYNADAANTSLD